MNIKEFLTSRHVPFEVFSHPRTQGAQRLAEAVHVSGQDVAKTVLLRANHGFAGVVAVVPAPKSLDLAKVSDALGGSKVELASGEDLLAYCEHCEPGMLPPFGSAIGLQTIVDESLTADDEIVFEGSSHEEAIRMKFADFRSLENPLILSIAK